MAVIGERPTVSSAATPDATIATRFHETFQELLSSSKREAMQELSP